MSDSPKPSSLSAENQPRPVPANLAVYPKMLAKMARVFLDVYPQWLATIREALHNGDAGAVSETAHKFKGSVSHFDAPAAEAARLLEQLSAANDLAGAETAYATLEEMVRELHPSLVHWAPPDARA